MHDIELTNWEEIYFYGNLSLKEGENSVGLWPGFDFRIMVTSHENQE